MPIYDQGYQHWKGRLSGHAWRWLAISRQGVRQQLRRRRAKWLVAMAFIPALLLAGVLVIWGLLEQQSSLLQPLAFLLQVLPDAMREGPKTFRPAVWTYAFNVFFTIETFFAMLLVLSVGPDLISQDLRFNAVPLYLSRPIRRIDYFAGKLGVIGLFLAAVAIAPSVAAYFLGVAFSLDPTVVRDTWRVLVGSIAYGSVVVLSAGTLMLAISSLSRNSRLVGATWVGLWVVGNVTAGVLTESVEQEWCHLVSYTTNLDRIREELLNTAEAREKFMDLWKAGQETRSRAAPPIFRLGNRRNRPPRPERPPEAFQAPRELQHPWTWSAGVLAGLFVLSTLALTTRIKSLDRIE